MITTIFVGWLVAAISLSLLVFAAAAAAYYLGVTRPERVAYKAAKKKAAKHKAAKRASARADTSLTELFNVAGVRDHSQPTRARTPYAPGRFPVAHRPGTQPTRVLPPPIDHEEVPR